MIDDIDIETIQTKNEQNVQSVYSPTEINIVTATQTAPQIQTIIQPYANPIVTIVDAPWVSVTSVNGKTGDVVIEVQLTDFKPNHFYAKGTAIVHDSKLYYAKQDFTSGSTFNSSDWDTPQITQQQTNWSENDTTSVAYIQNKPTKLSDFTNDEDYQTGTQVSTALETKVDKITGKGLSTEDYTSAEKTKLGGIANGAEVNVQSDWNQSDTAADDYIKNKPIIPVPTVQVQTDWNETDISDVSYIKNKPTIPSKASDLVDDNIVVIDLAIDGQDFFSSTDATWPFTVPRTGYWEVCNPFTVTCYEKDNVVRYLWLNLDTDTTRDTSIFGYTYDATNRDDYRGDTRRQITGTSRVISLTAGVHTITKRGFLPTQWRSDYNEGMCYPQLFLRWVCEDES